MATIEGSQIVAGTLQDQGANMIFTEVGGPVIAAVQLPQSPRGDPAAIRPMPTAGRASSLLGD